MILHHLTWDIRVPSILKDGLIPSHSPNKWYLPAARERSKGKLFLCTADRKAHWQDIYEGDWAGCPKGAVDLVWVEVDCTGLDLKRDEAPNEDYHEGDYWTAVPIPPDRIKGTKTCNSEADP